MRVKRGEGGTRPCIFSLNDKLSLTLDRAVNRVIKKKWDYVAIVSGLPGCITGDTIIRTNRNTLGRKFSIKYLYNQYHNNPDKVKRFIQWDLNVPTYVRTFNGEQIRLHKIKDVVYSGKKKVYKLSLADGKFIKATGDHKIMTNNGFIELLKLNKDNDLVMCDTPNTRKSGKMDKIIDIEISGLIYHKVAKNKTRPRMFIHQIIYEANMNNLSFEDYTKILRTDEVLSSSLKCIPKGMIIHHKDGNHFNNNLNNLQMVSEAEHLKIHGEECYKNFSQGIPTYQKINKIEELGIEDTYDIQCEDPHHNFSANDIIIHNSGKSSFAQMCAKYVCDWFDESYVAFSGEEFIRITNDCPEYSSVILDEAFESLNNKISMSQDFIRVVNHLQIIRQKHLFIFICLPNFFDLSKGVAVFRSSNLFVTYGDEEDNRGPFLAFGRDEKRKLYVRGLKYMDYNAQRANFNGMFTNPKIIPEDLYEDMKRKHMEAQDKTKHKMNRYEKSELRAKKALVKIMIGLSVQKNMTLSEISKMCDTPTSTLRDWASEFGMAIREERNNVPIPLEMVIRT